MRILFAGTPAAAVPSLTRLVEAGHDVAAVLTRPDAPLGRKRTLTPSPVAQEAERLGLPLLKAARVDTETTEALRSIAVDLAVVVAYGALVREPALSLPTHGWINLHFSVLPAWRGAAPVQRAVMAGETTTGASVFQLVPELDAGPVFGTIEHPIGRHATAGDLLGALATVGADLLADVVAGIADGTAVAAPQIGEPTFAPKLTLVDGALDWHSSAVALDALIRGVTPEPGAHTLLDGERFKIPAAAVAHDGPALAPGQVAAVGRTVVVGTGDGLLKLITVQPFGRSAMAAPDWLRGRQSPAVFGG